MTKFSELEKTIAKANVTAMRAQQKHEQKRKFIWHNNAVEIIKQQLAERKARNLPNDWKPAFYERKLKTKHSIIGKLAKLIKK